MTNAKKCSVCKQPKPFGAFHKAPNGKHQPVCKICSAHDQARRKVQPGIEIDPEPPAGLALDAAVAWTHDGPVGTEPLRLAGRVIGSHYGNAIVDCAGSWFEVQPGLIQGSVQ